MTNNEFNLERIKAAALALLNKIYEKKKGSLTDYIVLDEITGELKDGNDMPFAYPTPRDQILKLLSEEHKFIKTGFDEEKGKEMVVITFKGIEYLNKDPKDRETL